jgi:hypothetical protein
MKDLLPLFTISLKAQHQNRDENKEPDRNCHASLFSFIFFL